MAGEKDLGKSAVGLGIVMVEDKRTGSVYEAMVDVGLDGRRKEVHLMGPGEKTMAVAVSVLVRNVRPELDVVTEESQGKMLHLLRERNNSSGVAGYALCTLPHNLSEHKAGRTNYRVSFCQSPRYAPADC